MSQSTINSSGSTQNPFCASGKGQMLTPIPQTYPIVVLPPSVNYNVQPWQSGTLFCLPTGGATAFLPTGSNTPAGANYKFELLGGGGTQVIWTIAPTGGGGSIYGSLINETTTISGKVKSNAASVVFATGAGLGDQMQFTFDGTNYSVYGYSCYTGGFT